MREQKVRQWKEKFLLGALTLILVSMFGIFGSFTSYAESQGKVISAKGAVIRKEPNTTSDKVGSAGKDKMVTILNKVDGTNGTLAWYQVQVDGITGYIRSDLLEVVDETPNGGEEEPAVVTPMDPSSATVTEAGRIRANASVSSQIVSEVPKDLVLAVTGHASDADGNLWYQVSYNAEDSQVSGFIRSDYVTTPVADAPPAETQAPEPDVPATPQNEQYQILMQDDQWCLYDTALDKGYKITDLFEAAENVNKYSKMYNELEATAKNQKIIVIILVFLLVAAVAAIAFLVFKIKDMTDAAYFSEVENDTLRRRKASTGQGGGQKVMHTVGSGQGRPAGQLQGARPAGNGQGRPAGQGPGARPVGTGQGRPADQVQGARPVSNGQRRPVGQSQGTRPAGAVQGRPAGQSQGARPVGAGQGRSAEQSQGVRPAGSPQGARPAGEPQGMRSVGEPRGKRPADAPQGARPAQASQDNGQKSQPKNSQQAGGWQSKNFMADEDDEFEFEFLNYETDEQK